MFRNNLKPWDGECNGFKLDDKTIASDLMIDEDGNIFYPEYKTGKPLVWCSAARLAGHIRNLNAILAR